MAQWKHKQLPTTPEQGLVGNFVCRGYSCLSPPYMSVRPTNVCGTKSFMNHKYALGLLLTMSVMSPVSAIRAAEPQSVLLSEIAWAGSEKSTADEWIELRNMGPATIDIGGWSITGIGTSGAAITIPTATSMNAGSTYLVANYAITDSKTTLVVTPNLVTTAVSIPNTSLNVTLLDSGGGIIDSLVDPGTPNFGSSTTFSTMKRNPTTQSWFTESASGNVSHVSAVSDSVSSTSTDVTATAPAIISDPVPIIDSTSNTDLASTTDPVSISDSPPIVDAILISDSVSTENPPSTSAVSEAPATTATDATPPIDSASNISPTSTEPPITETISIDPDSSTNLATAIIINPPVIIEPEVLATSTEVSQEIVETPIAQTSTNTQVSDATPTSVAPDVIASEVVPSAATEPVAIVSTEIIPAAVDPIADVPAVIDPIAIAPATTTSAITPPVTTSSIVSTPIAPPTVQTSTTATTPPIPAPIPTATETQSLPASSIIVGNIIINEVLPSPSTGNDEWVELENMTSSAISLAGLTLVDASGKITDLAGSISANGYAVIANPNGNLNNDAETVTLMNGSTILDSVSYGTDANPAPKKDYALTLLNGSWVSQQSSPAASNIIVTSSSTTTIAASSTSSAPIIPTISPTLYANSTTLVAAEQAANTTGSNQSSRSAGTQSSHSSHVATAKSSISTTHSATLATASVKIASPTTITTKSSSSTKTSKAKSSTKKKAVTTESSVRSVTLDDISSIADGAQVQLEGIVVAAVGILGKRSFFIDGLEIYQGSGTLADVNVGDHVSITGEVSVLSDHRRINIKENGIAILDSTNPIVHDYEFALPYGSLVRITGTISARDGDAVLLKTEDVTIKIVAGSGVNVAWADLAGVTVTATGILKHGNQETVVLRSANDVVKAANTDAEIIASVAGTTSSSKASLLWEAAAFLAFASAGFGTWVWYSRPRAHGQKLILHHNTV